MELRSLADLHHIGRHLGVYNTESNGVLHETLRRLPRYTSSEYFGPGRRPGEMVNGVQHQDLMRLGFESESFELVLSSDVMEHVPEPYCAHREIHRVLRNGGRHIFTVPFHAGEIRDDRRAEMAEDGRVVLLKEPAIYHDDPLRPEGVLVYTIFALEMLVRLAEIGFRTTVYHLRAPWYGIVGDNAIVFDALKQ